MNQRISELLPKPWTFPYPDREMYSKEQMEELAELIVRKCAEHAEHAKGTDVEFETYFKAMIFGVKE